MMSLPLLCPGHGVGSRDISLYNIDLCRIAGGRRHPNRKGLPMNCPSCSQPLKPGARFCAECGATVGPPPATDKTMIASALPAYAPPAEPGQTAAAGPPTANSAPTLPQNYAQPQQYQYGGQPQPQPYGEQPQPQPQPYSGQQPYAQAPQQYQYGGQRQAYAPAGYAVQPTAAVPAANGRIPAILLLLCSLALVASLFLPFLISIGQQLSVVEILGELGEGRSPDEIAVAWIFVAIPIVTGLSLLASAMAVWKRRQIWGALNLIFGLLFFGLSGLLLIGASVSENEFTAGSALWLMFAASSVMVVDSIVYLARKKAPR